jgi:hypothetical protein
MKRRMMAEFDSADSLVRAVRTLRAEQHEPVETFSNVDLPELDDTHPQRRSRLGWLGLAGGAAGLVGAYAVQWYTAVKSYPLNVGGRPLHAVPAFAVITFESTVLAAALALFAGLLLVLRFPRLWAREDHVEGFERASIDRFFLRFDDTPKNSEAIRATLTESGALRVFEMDDA